MEHLFTPVGRIPEVSEYPGYVDYIGVSFLDYPKLRDRQVYLQAETDYVSEARLSTTSDQDDSPFLATWLFCSLLQDLFGICQGSLGQDPLFRHTDFIRPAWSTSGDRQTVVFHTSKLMPLLEEWSASVSDIILDRKDYYEHLKRCLTIAHNVLHWPCAIVQPEVKNILASVGELISVTVNLTFRNVAYYDPETKCPFMWPTSVLIQDFIPKASSVGWCPFEVATIPSGDGPFFPTIYFRISSARTQPNGIYTACPGSRQTTLPESMQVHAKCSLAECRSYNLQKPHDRQPYCSCSVFSFQDSDWQQMLRIIDVGIPLLRCRETKAGLEVSVVPFQPGVDYVAISHVWSHGLGNPDANEILSCRLAYIVRSVMECWEMKGQKRDEVLLWFDTLCCPVSPAESKAKVLVTMREVYTQANHVLILDGELTNLDIANRTNLEVGVRILTSDWMRRLWTLQEGLLPREVWVKFKNSSFLLDSLKEVDPYKVPFNQYRVAKYVQHLLYSIRRSLATKETLTLRSWILIEAAVRQRKVTVAADEALCLSTLMDLDTAAIANTNPPDRMQSLWREINASDIGIPKGIIFEGGPRLTTQGFRWAQTSLLNKNLGATYALDSERAVLTESGLLIRNKGIILSHMCASIAFKTHLDRETPELARSQESTKVEFVRDQHGCWLSLIREREKLRTDPSRTEELAGQRSLSTKVEDVKDVDQAVTDMILSNPEHKYAVIISQNINRVHIVRLETRVNETQHVSIARPIAVARRVGPHLEFAYEIAQRLAASRDFQAMNYAGMQSEIWKAAGVSACLPEACALYLPQGFDQNRFQVSVTVNAMLMLAGYGYLQGETVPETQEWCYT